MLPMGHSSVAKRRVFYIPGYDPIPPRRYRELYRTESKKQAAISGYEIDQKPAKSGDSWRVRGRIGGATTLAKIDVLVWNDIVKSSMRTNIPGTYWALLKTAWIYLSTGSLRRLSWLAKGPILAAVYPVAMLLVQLVLAVSLAWFVGAQFSKILWPGFGWIVALPILIYGLRLGRKYDDRTYAYYLMHDFAFSAANRGAYPDAVEDRMDEFRARIAAALDEDVDEVLVIGHSSGAQMAVSIVADLVRSGRARKPGMGGPTLSLLTLGQVIPMVSFLPEARRLRRDLHDLSTAEEITWVDISAPGDGCAFALSDPVAVSGVAPIRGHQWPLVLSAAFTQTLEPETLAALRHRYFRLHFQYLCAFDRPGDYDYFGITAGPLTLAERFRGRTSSASRIDVAASRYTTMAA